MDVRGKDGTSSSRPCACSGSPVKFPGVCVLTTSLFAVSYIPLTRPPTHPAGRPAPAGGTGFIGCSNPSASNTT